MFACFFLARASRKKAFHPSSHRSRSTAPSSPATSTPQKSTEPAPVSTAPSSPPATSTPQKSTEPAPVSTPPATSTPQKSAEPAPVHTQQSPSTIPNINPSASSSQATPAPSRSALLRAQGNALYKQASDAGFCSTIRRAKISHALHFYTQALHASSSPDETASCFKNLGMLHWLSCKLEVTQQLLESHSSIHSLSPKRLSVCKSYLFDTIRSLLQAIDHAENCKPKLWLEQLYHVLNSIPEWAVDQSSLLPISHSPLLQYLCEAFEYASPLPTSAHLVAYKNFANALFKEALATRLPDESMDYKGCHSLLHDCSVPLRRGICYLAVTPEDKSLQQELRELQDSVNVHLCICEAMQAIALGDVSLSEAVFDEEDMDMEKVRDSLDYYRKASIATRELDMETEAIALSRIGKVYSDVLKLHVSAHKFHFQAVRLALTVMSPSIARAEWYKCSLEKVKAHQEAVAEEEREQHEKDREPAVQRLKEKISALSKQASYSAESFLKYVYAEHPHPDLMRNVVPLVGTDEKLKASLKKALLHYHPDRNVKFEKDWKVLCEEICKHLNVKYASIKGCST